MSSRSHSRAAGHGVVEVEHQRRHRSVKHNVASGKVQGLVEIFRMVELRVPNSTGIMERDVELDFADGGCTYADADADRNECNIAWGDQVWANELVLPAVCFQRVRSDFQCCVGQKGCDFGVYGKRCDRFRRIRARVVHGRGSRNDLWY
jgi:hypothetical protein